MVWGRGSKDKYPSDWNSRRKKVLERDGHTCQECGQSKARLQAHHIKPISEGGSHKLSNLKAVCKPCHEDIHGHAVGGGSTGRRRRGSSAWKQLVWTPALGGNESNDVDIDWDLDLWEGLKEAPSRSKGEKQAEMLGLAAIPITFISPWLAFVIADGLLFQDISTAILVIVFGVIFTILIPLLWVPLVFASVLVGLAVIYVARFFLEWYHGELWDIYGDTWAGTLYQKIPDADDETEERRRAVHRSARDRRRSSGSYIASRRLPDDDE